MKLSRVIPSIARLTLGSLFVVLSLAACVSSEKSIDETSRNRSLKALLDGLAEFGMRPVSVTVVMGEQESDRISYDGFTLDVSAKNAKSLKTLGAQVCELISTLDERHLPVQVFEYHPGADHLRYAVGWVLHGPTPWVMKIEGRVVGEVQNEGKKPDEEEGLAGASVELTTAAGKVWRTVTGKGGRFMLSRPPMKKDEHFDILVTHPPTHLPERTSLQGSPDPSLQIVLRRAPKPKPKPKPKAK